MMTDSFLFSEAIVHAGSDQAEAVAVRRARHDEVVVGQIDIEIFDLGAPILIKGHLGAGAERPARVGMGFRQTEGGGAQFAEGDTAGAEEQDVAERVAGATPNRAEPGVGEFPRREGIVGAGYLDVAFEAEHKWSVVEIITRLHAADETGRLGRTVCDRSPGIAEIAAEIETG